MVVDDLGDILILSLCMKFSDYRVEGSGRAVFTLFHWTNDVNQFHCAPQLSGNQWK